MSSGRTGTRASARPVASRSADTIAAVETTVGGSTAAIVSALRDATGRELARVPVRPDDIVGL